MKKEITKTLRIDLELNSRIQALADQVGTDHTSILRTVLKIGFPIVERHYQAMFRDQGTYPISKVTALRAAEAPKKSAGR